MCKLLVYGYSVGIRSSRALEHACRNNVDFIWLMAGRAPDHDTIANFRREHRKDFKSIFATSVAACEEAGMISLAKLAVDGTRVEANNAGSQTKTAADLEQMLEKLDARIEKIVAEAEAADRREDMLFGPDVTPFNLPKELKDLQGQQAKLSKALEKVQAKAKRAMEFKGASAEEAAKKRVPITDPDADVMKDKKKRFGPNYTPYVGVDVESGVVTSEGVTNSHGDADHLQPAIEEAEANTHKQVGQVQADSGYATPDNIAYCERRQIDPCIAPVKTNPESKKDKPKLPPWPEDVPRNTPDVKRAVVCGPSLPRTSQGKFDKSAFRYDALSDSYTCPLGHSMPSSVTKKRRRASGVRSHRSVRPLVTRVGVHDQNDQIFKTCVWAQLDNKQTIDCYLDFRSDLHLATGGEAPDVGNVAGALLLDEDGNGIDDLIVAGVNKPVDDDCLFAFDVETRKMRWAMSLSSEGEWNRVVQLGQFKCLTLAKGDIDGRRGDEIIVSACDSANNMYPTRISIIDPRACEIDSTFWNMGHVHDLLIVPDFFETRHPAIVFWGLNNKLLCTEMGWCDDSAWTAVMGILDPAQMNSEGSRLGPPGNESVDVASAQPYAYAYLSIPARAHPGALDGNEMQRPPSGLDEIGSIHKVEHTSSAQTVDGTPWFKVAIEAVPLAGGSIARGTLTVDGNLVLRDFLKAPEERAGKTREYWAERWHVISPRRN